MQFIIDLILLIVINTLNKTTYGCIDSTFFYFLNNSILLVASLLYWYVSAYYYYNCYNILLITLRCFNVGSCICK